jgi:hypothetical protein
MVSNDKPGTQMTTLVSTASDAAHAASDLGAAYKPFEHHGMYAFFARARTQEPVFFSPAINYWVVTRREDILPLLQETALFSADIALAPATPLTPEAVAILKAGMGAEPTQVNCDPPKHTASARLPAGSSMPSATRPSSPTFAGLRERRSTRSMGGGKSISWPTSSTSFPRACCSC